MQFILYYIVHYCIVQYTILLYSTAYYSLWLLTFSASPSLCFNLRYLEI